MSIKIVAIHASVTSGHVENSATCEISRCACREEYEIVLKPYALKVSVFHKPFLCLLLM